MTITVGYVAYTLLKLWLIQLVMGRWIFKDPPQETRSEMFGAGILAILIALDVWLS